MQITNLYKFPIKGFTPKEVRQIDFDCFGNVQGDRVFGFLLNVDFRLRFGILLQL